MQTSTGFFFVGEKVRRDSEGERARDVSGREPTSITPAITFVTLIFGLPTLAFCFPEKIFKKIILFLYKKFQQIVTLWYV